MPANDIQWGWFMFWGVGAVGGWLVVAYVAVRVIDALINCPEGR